MKQVDGKIKVWYARGDKCNYFLFLVSIVDECGKVEKMMMRICEEKRSFSTEYKCPVALFPGSWHNELLFLMMIHLNSWNSQY